MELDNRSLANSFPDIVEAIASSAAVVLDVELSGVSRKKHGVQRDFQQSLGDRYAEMREAAQKYGILQVGITVLQSLDPERARARTYNVNLTPLISPKIEELGLDRDISIQSSALQFLASNRFHIADTFTKGVPYLSRNEEETAQERALARSEPKAKGPLIQLADDQQAAKGLVDEARKEIRKRIDVLEAGTEQLSIYMPRCTFTNFHRLLVYRLVEEEFPCLNAFPSRDTGGVMVGIRKEERLKRAKQQQQWRLENDLREINRHTGFRWVMEALCSGGGNLQDLNLDEFPESPYRNADIERAAKAIRQLRNRPTPFIVAGHNVFNDLVYLIQWFLEDLPETAEDFQKTVHRLFPRVLDTKYMATYDWVHGELHPDSSLETVFKKLNGDFDGKFDRHEDFLDSLREVSAHQAGYDSYVSACALLLMCKKNRIGKASDGDGDGEGDAGEEALGPYLNRLRIFGAGKASMMDLEPGRQPGPPRSPARIVLEFKSHQPQKSKNGNGPRERVAL